ncbi:MULTISPECIES: aromatic acid exporter family protein [unclassified Streptomyces]|uniref:aromatic acid exporter family protein n=1 Tax=unclassified Streptomyces TaxID=2593676 RepID=UPI002E30ACF4|nr:MULTISPECIES: aromatic acid exporter family protein [unclassified Streptomyces]
MAVTHGPARRMYAAAREAAAYVRRGVGSPGTERDDLIRQAKTVVAAMAAWALAHRLLPPTVTTFAPFTAILALQATLYRSVRECVRYLGAMVLGAALAAGLAAQLGIHAWSFGLLALLALVIGRVRHLGSQGLQVAVVGFFAFTSGHGRIDYIGHLAGSVALGALCGLSAHLLLAPARHVRHRQQAVADLYGRLRHVVTELAAAAGEGDGPTGEQVGRWRRACDRVAADAPHVQASVDAEAENSRLNPRRADGRDGEVLPRAQEAGAAAGRSAAHLHSLLRSLSSSVDSGHYARVPPRFLSGYGALLDTVAAAMEEVGRPARTDRRELDALVDEGLTLHEDLEYAAQQDTGVPAPVRTLCGALLTDASRLLHELRGALPEPAGTRGQR